MTAQVHDNVVWDGSQYRILVEAWQGETGLFEPVSYGFKPKMISTGCYRGFYLKYGVVDEGLYLSELTIRDQSGKYPELNGVRPVFDDKSQTATYKSIMLPIKVSGVLRIGKEFIRNRYVHMGYQETLSFKIVKDLTFEDGRLCDVCDRSRETRRMRKAREAVKLIMKDYLPTKAQLAKLLDTNGLIYASNIERTFYPELDPLDADAVYAVLKEIKTQRCTPAEFLHNYSEYYASRHRYDFTFSFIAKLGCPSRILTFLRKLVSTTSTEFQVTVAFMETMRTKMGGDILGETINVITGKQYMQAGVDPAVKAAIEKRLTRITPDSWLTGNRRTPLNM